MLPTSRTAIFSVTSETSSSFLDPSSLTATSMGSSKLPGWSSRSVRALTSIFCSFSTCSEPLYLPLDLRKTNATSPESRILSALLFAIKASIASILSVTLAPPSTVT